MVIKQYLGKLNLIVNRQAGMCRHAQNAELDVIQVT